MIQEALLVVDKVPGPTSFDVVREVRRLSGVKKVGHSGSLDPFASGVLVLLLGRATKLSNILLNADKRYFARIELGRATDSMDRTGEVTEEAPVGNLEKTRIEELFLQMQGVWEQTPPMFSAKKVKGVRLYELARKKIEIERKSVPVRLYELLLRSQHGNFIDFEVHCSKGTYVRALADEISRRLGTVGHLSELRRLAVGGFSLKNAITIEEFKENMDRCLSVGHANYLDFLTEERKLNLANRSIVSKGDVKNPGVPGKKRLVGSLEAMVRA